VPGFKRANFGDIIENSDWPECSFEDGRRCWNCTASCPQDYREIVV
jgi:hypothetical protein